MLGQLILAAYALALAGLVVYSVHRGWLLLTYRRLCRRAGFGSADGTRSGSCPHVTVQLPIYNERYVAERLIDAVCALDYPRDRLAVQALDDSDDDTAELIARCVRRHAEQGVRIAHIRRGGRDGYKAGALAHGLARAHGEFVLVLDADFVPPPDFLRRMLPPFADPSVGMVQARWGHLNADTSWLARAQALMLDAHFHLEHGARQAAGLFFNFNGTAGLWRARCIVDAGGWQSDTLTEDLDLSYRAQMRGWRLVYLPEVVVPGELPRTVRAFKSQQARWARGSVETARKVLPALWREPWPWRVKLEAALHLTGYVPSALTLAVAVLVLPAALVRLRLGVPAWLFADLFFFAAAVGPIGFFYAEAIRASGRRVWPRLTVDLPLVLALGIGVSASNTRALLAGLLGRGGAEFVRTPKWGRSGHGYRAPLERWSAAVEMALAIYTAAGVGGAAWLGLYPALPFLLLFAGGFAAVAAGSLREPSGRGRAALRS
jgi:hypothetical protein